MSTATGPITMASASDAQFPQSQPNFRTLESTSGHLCDSFMQQEESDLESYRGVADWECRHGFVVWHEDLHAAAERAQATQAKLR